MATPRRAGGKLSRSTAWAMGCSAPPPRPCSTRARIRMSRRGAAPQIADAAVNSTIHVSRKRLRPKSAPHQAAVGRMMALDTR